MNKVLVTGSTGYVGSAVVRELARHQDYELVLPVRKKSKSISKLGRQVSVRDIGEFPPALLDGIDTVVHLAAKAHDLSGARHSADEIRRVNSDATKALADLAASAGVKKFIYLSSIGVCGGATQGRAFDESSEPRPHSLYAASKLDAEKAIKAAANSSGMEFVIIRPPMVYSGSAPGNFRRLLKLVSLRLPLPFYRGRNKRSIIALENLAEFVRLCIDHRASGGNVFLIADGEDVSTEDIVRCLASGMNKKIFLFYLPHWLPRSLAYALGRSQIYTQLWGSLQIDTKKAREVLSWTPRIGPKEALIKAGCEYSHEHSRSLLKSS